MSEIFGTISPPVENNNYFNENSGGLLFLIGNILKFAGVIAGIFFIIKIIIAGFTYISGAGDPKKTAEAWSQIWQSIIGLVIVSGAFVITAVIGRLVGLPNILNIQITGPQ